jgi:hypothetical protein
MGLVPGGIGGALGGIVIASVEASLCRNSKSGYVVPGWAEIAEIVMPLVAAAIAARVAIPDVAQKPKGWPSVRGTLAWSTAGALVGGLAWVWTGFDGYFIRQSNAGPIRSAIFGAVVGGLVAGAWRLGLGELSQRARPARPSP